MIAASVEGSVFTLVIMVAFALINWVATKVKNANETPPKQPGSPAERPEANSEEERMRKFMEALGIPEGANPPARRRETPPPIRAEPPTRRQTIPPVPPFVSGPSLPRRQKPAPVLAPPPIPKKISADQQPAPHLPVEQIHLAPLVTPTVAQYSTVSSTISAMPGEHLQPLELGRSVGAELSPLAVLVRKSVSSPLQLRSAFVLREVLGPPRSLQT